MTTEKTEKIEKLGKIEKSERRNQRINRRIRVQHGLITRSQALDAGMSSGQIARKLSSEDWLRVRGGVYRHSAVPVSYEARLLAATLGRRAVVSHRSAAALWNLEPFSEPDPEITVPYGTRSRGQQIHISSQWHQRDECLRRGIACTGIERTIMDCAGQVPLHEIELAAESAIRQKLTSWNALNTYLAINAAPGRDGTGGLRRLLRVRAGTPTVTRSGFSLRVSRLLVDAGLPKPVVEYPVVDQRGNHILFLDLAWPSLRKAWELDGLAWHFGRHDMRRDKFKRNSVKAQGWAIQEILWEMYIEEPERLIAWARDFLDADAAA